MSRMLSRAVLRRAHPPPQRVRMGAASASGRSQIISSASSPRVYYRAGPPVLLDLAIDDERISGNMRVVGFTSSNRRIRSCAVNDSHNVDHSQR